MMHCTMEDLGALRAGEASVWARRHITTCATCQAELEGLYQRVAQLKALPALRPPRDGWPAIKAVVRAERSRKRRTWGAWTGSLALAATLARAAGTAEGWGTRPALRRAEPGEAAIGDTRRLPAAIRHRRPCAQRTRGGPGGGAGRPHCRDRRQPGAAAAKCAGRPTRETLARAGRSDAGVGERPRHARPLRRALKALEGSNT